MNTRILQSFLGLFALATTVTAQTSTTTGFAPANFGNVVLTSTPSNATGASGVSTVFTSSGSQLTLGTGGALVNPMQYNYTVTGPNTATYTMPASGSTPASTTNLVFTGPNSGTYTTVSGTTTTTGSFGLATIPSAAPIANVSSRAFVKDGGSTTVGFVIAGTAPRRVLIRAVGPALSTFGVTDALQNPSLALYNGTQVIARNDQWGTMASSTSTGSTSTGGTSTGTSSTGGTSTGTSSTGGTSTGTSSTGGTSTGTSSTGGTSMGGAITSGTSTTTSSSGVMTGTLAATGSSYSVQLATAQNFAGTGAFALQSGSNDSALVATLPPGAYTVVVSASTAGTSGGTSTGGTSTGGTSTGGTSTGGTSTGGTSTGGTSTGGTSTGGTSTGGTSTGGTSTGGTSTGGTSTGTTSTGGTSSTSSAATSSTSGTTLVEVYFIQ